MSSVEWQVEEIRIVCNARSAYAACQSVNTFACRGGLHRSAAHAPFIGSHGAVSARTMPYKQSTVIWVAFADGDATGCY
eukprot:5800054-Pleurochrysis_carterae.AAC.1